MITSLWYLKIVDICWGLLLPGEAFREDVSDSVYPVDILQIVDHVERKLNVMFGKVRHLWKSYFFVALQ